MKGIRSQVSLQIQACFVGFSKSQLVAKHIHSSFLYLLLVHETSADAFKHVVGNDCCVRLSL